MKINGTRKRRAGDLLLLLERGPASLQHFTEPDMPCAFDTADAAYRMWAESWIIPLVKQLVPELQRKEKEREAKQRHSQGR